MLRKWRKPRRQPVRLDTAVAAEIRSIAAALAAGVPAGDVWRWAAEDPRASAAVRAARAVPFCDVPSALMSAGTPWNSVGAVWAVGQQSGAPLASALSELAAVRDSTDSARMKAREARAGPQLSARIVLAAPAAALLVAWMMGSAPMDILFGSVIGVILCLIGVTLCFVAWLWSRRILRWAEPSPAEPDLHCVLTAVCLEGGMDRRRSRELASRECERANIDVAGGLESSTNVMGRAELFGAPVAAALRAEGQRLRAEQASAAMTRVAELPGRLILPLGICILPAFFAIGIIPAVLSVIGSSLQR